MLCSVQFWEPFTVQKRVEPDGHLLPRYHEPFVGRHRNKIDFISSLRAESYHFATLLREFVAHVPHAQGPKTDDGDVVFKEMMFLYQKRRLALGRQFNATRAELAQRHFRTAFDGGFVYNATKTANSPLT
jgi:hypothetical protein